MHEVKVAILYFIASISSSSFSELSSYKIFQKQNHLYAMVLQYSNISNLAPQFRNIIIIILCKLNHLWARMQRRDHTRSWLRETSIPLKYETKFVPKSHFRSDARKKSLLNILTPYFLHNQIRGNFMKDILKRRKFQEFYRNIKCCGL